MRHYKSGRYGIYNGKEYEVNRYMYDKKGIERIYTTDLSKIDENFEDIHGQGVYSKKIQLEDLEEYYKITTYAIWNDMKFLLMGEKEDCYILFTEESKIAKEYGFEVHDRDCFTKDVKKDSVKLIERREDLM